MKDHLSDEQLANSQLAEDNSAVASHLADCAECRSEREKLASVLGAVRRHSLAAAEQPEAFWRTQRLAVAVRLSSSSQAPTRVLAWAATAATVVLFALSLSQLFVPHRPRPGASEHIALPQWQPVDSDHALLIDVERSARRGVPRALEPATLIAQELHRAAERKTER